MKIIKLNIFTIYFLFIAFLCGYIKTALIILLIVLVHEFGHVFFFYIFKIKIKKIVIYPFGGITYVKKDLNTEINKELIIACGGIITQLILLIITYFLPLLGTTKTLLINYNIAIMIFNMIPIIPLDGSIILNCILNKFFSFNKCLLFKIIISFIFLILFIFFINSYNLNIYILVLFLLFKLIEYIKNYKYIYNNFLLERYLNDYKYKRIKNNCKRINELKLDTYHYFLKDTKIINEKEKLKERFDKKAYFW